MADTFTREKRSQIMSLVKSNHNKSTELRIIQFFKNNSIRGWRRKSKLFGKPDFVFPRSKVAVFVDGCFWHGHNCRNTKPQNNRDYWHHKISKNQVRDARVSKQLREKGWEVVRIWECEIKVEENLLPKLTRVIEK